MCAELRVISKVLSYNRGGDSETLVQSLIQSLTFDNPADGFDQGYVVLVARRGRQPTGKLFRRKTDRFVVMPPDTALEAVIDDIRNSNLPFDWLIASLRPYREGYDLRLS